MLEETLKGLIPTSEHQQGEIDDFRSPYEDSSLFDSYDNPLSKAKKEPNCSQTNLNRIEAVFSAHKWVTAAILKSSLAELLDCSIQDEDLVDLTQKLSTLIFTAKHSKIERKYA